MSERIKLIVAGATSGVASRLVPLLAEKYRVLALGRNQSALDETFQSDKVETAAVDYFAARFPQVEQWAGKQEKLAFINFCADKVDGLFVDQTTDNFRKCFEVNVLSAVPLLQKLIPKMIARRWGRVVFVSSSRAVVGDVGIAPYAAAKTALVGLSAVLSKEYARFGVTSNILQLGYYDTELWRAIPPDKRKELSNMISAKRLGVAEDIAPMITAVVESGYINGAILPVDGGD